MARHTETLGGTAIEIDDDAHLTIRGKDIAYEHDPDANTWSARQLPYTHYNSLIDLARALVRDTVEFVDPAE